MEEIRHHFKANQLTLCHRCFDSRTRFVSVVSGFLFDHHMGRRKPLMLWPGHVGRSVVQRVHVLLLEVLMRRIRQAGVRVLPMITSTPSGMGRMHALQGLALGSEWWAHLCRAGREPGTGRENETLINRQALKNAVAMQVCFICMLSCTIKYLYGFA